MPESWIAHNYDLDFDIGLLGYLCVISRCGNSVAYVTFLDRFALARTLS